MVVAFSICDMAEAKITSKGLKKDLIKKGYDPKSSICEYIWNGFDAGASKIDVNIQKNQLGGIDFISVVDNGVGIDSPERFFPVYESQKKEDVEDIRIRSLPHGKKGWGRYTFFTFAEKAEWRTVFSSSSGSNHEYCISINSNSLLDYKPTNREGIEIDSSSLVSDLTITEEKCGTSAKFILIKEEVDESEIISYLAQEFSWFIELNKVKNYELNINGSPLDYSNLIMDSDEFSKKIGGFELYFKFILWSCKQNDEYSRYYLIDLDGDEKFSKTTTLNNKGDDFFHSVFITGELFNDLTVLYEKTKKSGKPKLFYESDEGRAYDEMLEFLENYLHDKRKPFIAKESQKIINEFERQQVFHSYDENDELDQLRKRSMYESVKQIYMVKPGIFKSLTVEQRKIFIRFLEIIQESGQREKVFDVLNEVISLDSVDLQQLAKTLKTSKLSNVIQTIRLIEDRHKVVDSLKELVFKHSYYGTNESNLQKLIEAHYWIFGEKYRLVSAEEPNFEQALRGLTSILNKRDEEDYEDEEGNLIDPETLSLNHPYKNKQMDIFMCKCSKQENSIDHIVVELKHPSLRIGANQFEQVKKYMDVVVSDQRFNANNSNWEFILIGNKINKRIEKERQNVNEPGEKSLAYKVDNVKIYIKTWSEVFNDFDIKHNFLQEKLKLERFRLMEEESKEKELDTADKVTKNAASLTPSLPNAVVKTKKQKESR